MTKPPEPSVPADREIVTTRVLEAPRELVWRVWTDPQHVAKWWGPTGFTTTTTAMDVRKGGQWRFTMHGPDGRDYANLVTFLEVEAPARLVYVHGGEKGLEPVSFTTTVTFDPMPGEPNRTRLTMRAVFPSAEAREFVQREYGAVEGATQTVARLAEHVEALARAAATDASTAPPAGGEPFVIRRVVRAPRDAVFRVWTDGAHLARWFGPKECTSTTKSFELRPGGVYHYAMHVPGAPDTFGKWVFRSVQPPERLEFLLSFADAAGATIAPPFDPSWPREMLTVVTFEPHAGIGKGTVITVRWSAHEATPMAQRTFDAGRDAMHAGWNGTFDKLDAHLATSPPR
jgi:uncharacterized protein YndB with AHSA1/START domain